MRWSRQNAAGSCDGGTRRALRAANPGSGLHHHHGPSPGSWGYQASQAMRLTQNRLEWTLSLRNLGRHPMLVRLGWRLPFGEEFGQELGLDDGDKLRELARSHVEDVQSCCGIASLTAPGGRLVLLRGAPPVTALRFERHPTRSSLQVDLMTAGDDSLEPLPHGEELTLALTMDRMLAQRPPPTGCPAPPLL